MCAAGLYAAWRPAALMLPLAAESVAMSSIVFLQAADSWQYACCDDCACCNYMCCRSSADTIKLVQATMLDGLYFSQTLTGDYAAVLYRLQLLGFNAVRLPFSFQASPVASINRLESDGFSTAACLFSCLHSSMHSTSFVAAHMNLHAHTADC